MARDARDVDRYRNRCYRRRSRAMSRPGRGAGIGALMFPIYLVPVTIVASIAAIVGLYLRFKERE